MKNRALVFALILLSLPLASVQAAPSCADLDQWAASLPELPKDFASFAALPEGHRRAVYPLLADGERASLWQAHWQAALAGGGLSSDQQALIYEAIASFDESAFAALRPDARNNAAALENLKSFEAKVASLFDRKQATRLFAELGPVSVRQIFELEPGTTVPGGPVVTPGPPVVVIDCSCSTVSDWCTKPATCLSANCRKVSGCGTLWTYTCDGVCAQIVVPPVNP